MIQLKSDSCVFIITGKNWIMVFWEDIKTAMGGTNGKQQRLY
jgi:hypothetical protein